MLPAKLNSTKLSLYRLAIAVSSKEGSDEGSMNSYPAELVNQHYACMLVAGLNNAPQTIQPANEAPTSPSTSAVLPTSTTTPAAPAPMSPPSAMPPTAIFPTLCKDLVDMFNSRGRTSVWDPARRSAAVFHSVLVDHNVRLPPRKTRPNPRSVAAPPVPTANGASSSTTGTPSPLSSLPVRSPLSPLHPGSPLFSDGIIAPIWVRKHRELVPSVFVAFHCLAEPPSDVGTSSGQAGQSPPLLVAEDMEDLKRRDEELIRAIAERKRTLVERGIKMTVVLLTTRSLLENSSLEARLSHIRRSSGLDSKASLFVLTPVTRGEVNDFVTSLQSALYDAALDFYREHARRVRRKRGRYPPPPSIVQPILAAVASASPPGKGPNLAPLSREGWQVRAEYKLGTFAEFHYDREGALEHYLEAYDLLVNACLGSTMILPPRTKRWAEAKVLADALCVRIARLHMYADHSAEALKMFNRHLQRFIELSTGWGIGAATFEFWSWLAKQYRMFGDLIDAATREIAGSPLPPVELPEHTPIIPTNIIHPELLAGIDPSVIASRFPEQLLPTPAAAALGVSPISQLAGSGAYYYIAALCLVERQDRFLKAAKEEVDGTSSGALAYQHEQSVDHIALITEAYTRAYETFKRAKQQRLSLFLAHKIALTYASGSQPEMALRFLERITRTYRRESWDGPLAALLLVAAECAREVGDVESEARTLFELLSGELILAQPQRAKAAELLSELLRMKKLPEGKDAVRVSTSATEGPLVVTSTFYAANVDYGEAVHFQLRLADASQGGEVDLRFDEMRIHLGDEDEAIIIAADEDANESVTDVGRVEIGKLSGTVGKASLRWGTGTERVLSGSLFGRRVGPVRISHVTLLSHKSVPFEWTIELPSLEQGTPAVQPLWALPSRKESRIRNISLAYRLDPFSTFVNARQHRITTLPTHAAIAFLDESFKVVLRVSNDDTEAIDCTLDVFLQAGSDERYGDSIQHGDSKDASALRNIDFGSLQVGESRDITLVLEAKGAKGPRALDMIFRTTLSASVAASTRPHPSSQSERALSLVIPVAEALSVHSTASFRQLVKQGAEARKAALERFANGQPALSEAEAELERIDQQLYGTDDDVYVSASLYVTYECHSGEGVHVRSTRLILAEDEEEERSIWFAEPNGGQATNLNEEGMWEYGDRFAMLYELEMSCPMPEIEEPVKNFSTGHLEVRWSRPGSDEVITTHLQLPPISPPTPSPITLTLSSPTLVNLSLPFEIALTAYNASSVLSAHLHIALDNSEAFVFAGPRAIDIPVLLPNQSRVVRLRLVPLVVGRAPLPNVRAWDTRRQQGEAQEGVAVKVKHERAETEVNLTGGEEHGAAKNTVLLPPHGAPFTVLVLPA